MKTIIIQPQPPRECELCKAFEECRPYGPNGKWICYDCGIKNKEETDRNMRRHLFGEDA